MSQLTRRQKLDLELKSIIGSAKLYWEPPSNKQLTGDPRVIYERDGADVKYADNRVYQFTQRYKITIVYTNPNLDLAQTILEHFPGMCEYDRDFVSDNLHHSVLVLYY